MWTIGQLKQRGMFCFKANYWKAVLVALFVTLAGCTLDVINVVIRAEDEEDYSYSYDDDNFSYYYEYYDNNVIGNPFEDYLLDPFTNPMEKAKTGLLIGAISILGIAVAIVFKVFISNPIELGMSRFYYKNLKCKSDVKEVAYGFDRGYKNSTKVLFYRDLYILLWSLLFVIPGIVKMYEYRLVPYILAEYPEMSKEQALSLSRNLMMGEKGRAFGLDFSFIGWEILNALTFGILGIFYVTPYRYSTNAAFYEAMIIIKDPFGQRQNNNMNQDNDVNMNVNNGSDSETYTDDVVEEEVEVVQDEDIFAE